MRNVAFALLLAAGWFVAMFTTNACGIIDDARTHVVKLYGTVTNAVTREPLAKVSVEAAAYKDTSVAESAPSGDYAVFPKADAHVRATFSRAGFRTVMKTIETRKVDVRLDIAMSPER